MAAAGWAAAGWAGAVMAAGWAGAVMAAGWAGAVMAAGGGGLGGMFDTAMAPVHAAERHSSHTTTLVAGPVLTNTATLPMHPVDTYSDVPAAHHALLRTAGTTEHHTAAAVNTPPVGTTNCCAACVPLVQYATMPVVSEYGAHG